MMSTYGRDHFMNIYFNFYLFFVCALLAFNLFSFFVSTFSKTNKLVFSFLFIY
jgi:hypothetical protein